MSIIATVGPTLKTVCQIRNAIECGVTYFRLPLGYDQDYIRIIKDIRKAEGDLNTVVNIALDLPAARPRFILNKNMDIATKDFLDIYSSGRIAITNYHSFVNNLRLGDRLYSHDGGIKYLVRSITDKKVRIECVSGSGVIKNGNSLSVEREKAEYELLTSSEIDFFKEISEKELLIDCLIFSFSEDTGKLYQAIEYSCKALGYTPEIIAKVETKFGVYQANRIINYVDGMMLGRGDLSSVAASDFILLAQEELASICIKNNKKAVIATNVLTEFSKVGKPSFKEDSAVILAIKQGYTHFMLGKETVWSHYAIETIEHLNSIINTENLRGELTGFDFHNSKRDKTIIAIEGANGSGKSTLVKRLSKYFNIKYQLGVPDDFIEGDMKNKMVADAVWYSSCLYFLSGVSEKNREIEKNNEEDFSIIDRSLWSTITSHGAVDPNRLSLIKNIFNSIEELNVEPSLVIILRSSFSHCMQRINKKENASEKYLDSLVGTKEYYNKEDCLYDWISINRGNVLNICVDYKNEDEVFNEARNIIEVFLKNEGINWQS